MIKMSQVQELLELLGWEIKKQCWYDEEAVEGTMFISPDEKYFGVFGWDEDCNIENLIEAIKDDKEKEE